MPIQSTNLPLISLYLLMSTFYTFISLVWFVLLNHFRTKKFCPYFCRKILDYFLKKMNSSELQTIEKYNDILNLILFFLLLSLMIFTYLIILIMIIY